MSKEEKALRIQYIGAILWPSFLCACSATFFFFAMFDPRDLGPLTAWGIHLNRELGYTLGFFLFWLITAFSSGCTAWLIYGFYLIRSKKLGKRKRCEMMQERDV